MKKYLKFSALILLGIAGISLVCFSVWRIAIYIPIEKNSQEKIEILIKKGEGLKEISTNLKSQGLIRSSFFFNIYVLKKGLEKNLKAGKYLFSKSMNVPQIVEKMVSGDVIKRKFTIIEGWNLKDIANLFESQNLLSAQEFFEITGFPSPLPQKKDNSFPLNSKDFSKDFDFLKDKPKNLSLEGYLFPDTYEVSYEATPEEIIKKILSNFDKKLTQDLRKEIKNQNKTIFEIITMASLIEKEVKTLEDKKIVSGILWKRKKAGMPLQVDATITYITNKKSTKISREELKIDSPYNTYRYKGLPPAPICNPGIESIIAAIYPKKSEYWYYLSTPDGKTIFSRTLKEHNAAKIKYLK